MTQIRKIRSGWKTGSDQHKISAAIDKDLWEWLKDQPNKNRIINDGLNLYQTLHIGLKGCMIGYSGHCYKKLF